MPPPNGSSPARRRPTSTQGSVAAGAAPVRTRRSAASEPTGASPGAKVVATAGPASGEEFVLQGDEVVVGRSSENGVSIPDTSVSRKHVLLRKTPEGWAASDMGSGNGTLVNGEAIAEETLLKSGDVITLGDTELRFEDGGALARRPVPRRGTGTASSMGPAGSRASRPVVRTSRRSFQDDADAKVRKRKLVIRISALLVLVLGGAVGFRVYKEKQLTVTRRAAMSEQQRLDELRKLNQEGKNLVREGKWKEAQAKFNEVLELDPNFGGGSVQQYLERATKEIPNQELLQEAGEALARGELAASFKALSQVTSDTTQFQQRDKLREQLEKKADEKLGEARGLLSATSDKAKMQQLKAICEDVLAMRPEHRDATEYKKQAEDAIYRIEHPPPPVVAPETPWLEVKSLFQGGDQTGAYAKAEACAARHPPCRTLKQQIADFGDRLKKAESSSPAELLALIELDKRIGGSQSSLTRGIAKKAADGFYLKAASAKQTGNWALAIDNARKAILAEPGHPSSTALLADARNQAKEVYLRAYQAKENDSEQALKLFKDVLAMTPKDDEYHQKAEQQIERLSK